MKGKILHFINKEKDKTVFNPTAPFEFDRKKYIGVRVEPVNNEFDSRIFFAYEFDKGKNLWKIDYSLKPFKLQDPFYTKLKRQVFFSGIKVNNSGEETSWEQEFYLGDSIKHLEYFASGPKGMKDIRVVDLSDRIGVFTRPRGGIWGQGIIGYFEIKNVNELEKFNENDWYDNSKILDLYDIRYYWGGANQAIKLNNNEMMVIGHIAHQTLNKKNHIEKHYYGMSFILDRKKTKPDNLKIIARRSDFPETPSKKSPELDDIIFPGGIDLKTNEFYCGLSDFCAGKKLIKLY